MKFYSLLTFLFILFSGNTQTFAQGRDRCNDYANQMISFDTRARQTKCTGWNNHSNYQSHYNWCSASTPQTAQRALSAWGSRFQTCQFAASGSPAAQAQLNQQAKRQTLASKAFCKQHGSQMLNLLFDIALRRCSSSKLNFPIKANVSFEKVCLTKPAAESSALFAYWKPRVRNCRP
jgi:hypothetical protein